VLDSCSRAKALRSHFATLCLARHSLSARKKIWQNTQNLRFKAWQFAQVHAIVKNG
jgi:hypothetical protein